MNFNDMCDPFQSAYKADGIETALLFVINDMLCALNNKPAHEIFDRMAMAGPSWSSSQNVSQAI